MLIPKVGFGNSNGSDSFGNATYVFNKASDNETIVEVLDKVEAFINYSTANPTNITFNFSTWTTSEPPDERICDNWLDAQHALFQLANLFFAISFLTPGSFKYHCLFLRSLLLLGFALFIFWSGLVVCMLDVLGWNITFFIVNLCHIIYLGYSTYPVKFHNELEELYTKIFKPLKMTRFEFKSLTKLGKRYNLTKGNMYAVESVTKCGDKFSILLKGRLKVSVDKIFLHNIEPNEFVDSPEYESVTTETTSCDKYQVTVSAVEDSNLLVWPIETLDQFLQGNEYCHMVMNTLIGKDITHKMYQIQLMLMNRAREAKIRESAYRGCDDDISDDDDDGFSHGQISVDETSRGVRSGTKAIPEQIFSRCSSIINMRSNLVRSSSEHSIIHISNSVENRKDDISPGVVSHYSAPLPSSQTYETSV